jgi:hypothetical protein
VNVSGRTAVFVGRRKDVDVIVAGKMPFKSSRFKGSRIDKMGEVARFDNCQNVKMSGTRNKKIGSRC